MIRPALKRYNSERESLQKHAEATVCSVYRGGAVYCHQHFSAQQCCSYGVPPQTLNLNPKPLKVSDTHQLDNSAELRAGPPRRQGETEKQ